VPLQWAAKGVVVTQLEKDAIEYVGLVKIDLLGNRALATVDEAKAHCRLQTADCRSRGKSATCNPQSAIHDDPAVLDLLRRGDTLGVGQLESPALRHLLIQLRPAGLDDVAQALALIRPGAASLGAKEIFVRRRHGLEPVVYPHPRLEPLLRDTEGLMVYEDDALGVIQALTGLPPADADRLRKRITKYRTDEEALTLSREFLGACARQGVARTVAEDLWVQLAKFNQYSFCRSHAISYALIAWQSAWLKVHFPLGFWTAVLNNNQGMYPRRVYVEAAKRAGLTLHLPCLNRSQIAFTIEADEANAIRTGLGAVASLDQDLQAAILAEREAHGPYQDLADFRRRLRPGPETLALLIRCGAFDFTGRARPALFLEADLEEVDACAELFDRGPDWSPSDYGDRRRLDDEWELLGFIAGPPLMSLFRPGLLPGLIASRDLAEHVGRVVCVAGVVATSRQIQTREGKTMQFVTLEDEWGFIDVTLFPGACPPVSYLALGPYLAEGVVEDQFGAVTLTAQRFELQCSQDE
jgi:DNA polymerase III alpha subunit